MGLWGGAQPAPSTSPVPQHPAPAMRPSLTERGSESERRSSFRKLLSGVAPKEPLGSGPPPEGSQVFEPDAMMGLTEDDVEPFFVPDKDRDACLCCGEKFQLIRRSRVSVGTGVARAEGLG
jgi:hypothetical protein